MLEKVRVGMIGAGSMVNRVHYPSLASFDDVEIAAICDLDGNRSPPLPTREELSDNQVCNWGEMNHFRQK